MADKVYVIVRNDLSPSYKMVQGAHALAQFALNYPLTFKTWENQTLIFLGVSTYRALCTLYDTLKNDQYTYGYIPSKWCEPDLDNQLTAFCFVGESVLINELTLA